MSNRNVVIEFIAKHPATGDIHGHLLQMYDTIVQKSPKMIVELGVRGGVSTFGLSRAAQDTGANLTSVDILDSSMYCDWKKWKFVKMNDLDFADTIKYKIDVLFIDTIHTFDHTVSELRKFLPLMNDKGIIFLHDTNVNGLGVSKAIDTVFDIKGNWNTNFTIETSRATIKNYPHNYGMSYIFLK